MRQLAGNMWVQEVISKCCSADEAAAKALATICPVRGDVA